MVFTFQILELKRIKQVERGEKKRRGKEKTNKEEDGWRMDYERPI